MDRNTADVGWSDEQWNRANAAVQESAQKARIAAQFLPTTIQPDITAVAVPDRTLDYRVTGSAAPERRLVVDSTPATFLTSLAVNVVLTSQEVADSDQGAALIQFRRAANMIARLEDALIFCGQSAPGATPPGVAGLPPVFQVGAGGAQPGLVAVPPLKGPSPYFPRQELTVPVSNDPGSTLAHKIIDAIGLLEGAGHNGPFACVLGQDRYSDLHEPTKSMILPSDRATPFLQGPLLRSSTIPADSGVVVALGSAGLEIVVSSELHVRFLQITTEPRFVFRVSERIALRVSDWSAVLVLHPPYSEAAAHGEVANV